MKITFAEYLRQDAELNCKGIFFRGYNSIFYTGVKLESRIGIRLLKSKCCKGCHKCGHFDEYLNEFPEQVIGLDTIEDGKLYTLNVVNCSNEWESGIVDDWDIEIKEVSDENN